MAISTKNNLFSNQSMNQSSIKPVRGQIAHGQTKKIFSVSIDPSDTDVFYAGDAVNLNTTSTIQKGIIVEKSTSDSKTLGIIVYSPIGNIYSAESGKTTFEICVPKVNIHMEAAEAINRGDRLSIDDTDPDGIHRVKVAEEGENVIGIALEKATEAGDIFLIEHI